MTGARPWARLAFGFVATLAVGACHHAAPSQTRIQIDAGGPNGRVGPAAPVDPRIASAHFAAADAVPLGGLDGIAVVFDIEVDAASLRPQVFWVSLEDGTRVRAEQAVLSPASEDDENRTVWVIGQFGAPADDPPLSIAIFGRLYAEDGRPLAGLAADVSSFETPGHVVAAERVAPGPGRCEGATAAVRTYWIDALRDVTTEDLAKVHLTMDDGSTATPTGFDDQDLEHEQTADNVLDLCLGAAGRAVRLQIDAGAFTDPPGHRSGAVDIEIGDAVDHAV